MLTRMPHWRGRAATLADGRRVGAMRMGDLFAFACPDIKAPDGTIVSHGGTVAGKASDFLVSHGGAFFAAPQSAVTVDADALLVTEDPTARATLKSVLDARPVDPIDLGVPAADGE